MYASKGWFTGCSIAFRASWDSRRATATTIIYSLEGRLWLQLEWRALRRAVESSGSDRAEAIADALAFRRERRRLFPSAADNERRDEIREGLAAYRLRGSRITRNPLPSRKAVHSA